MEKKKKKNTINLEKLKIVTSYKNNTKNTSLFILFQKSI